MSEETTTKGRDREIGYAPEAMTTGVRPSGEDSECVDLDIAAAEAAAEPAKSPATEP